MGVSGRWFLLLATLTTLLDPRVSAQSVYEKDVSFALDELGRECGTLLDSKHIDWRVVTADQAHLVLLTRLLACRMATAR